MIKLLESGPLAVEVSSQALRESLLAYASQNQKNLDVRLCSKPFWGAMKLPVDFLKSVARLFLAWRFARKNSVSVRDLRESANLTLVDTYLTETSFSRDGYKDRYFGSYYDYLSDDQRASLVLVPSLVAVRKFEKIRSNIQYSSYRVFFKESVLSFKDILWVVSQVFGSYFLKKPEADTVGFWSLVKEDLVQTGSYYMNFEAFVTFRFIEHLKNLNLPIVTFINWHENHLYDRALAKAHADGKLFFALHSYQCCLYSASEFFIVPTESEIRSNLVARDIFFSGPDILSGIALPNNVVRKRSPLYRMQNIFELLSRKENSLAIVDKKRILVALPLVFDVAQDILKVIIQIAPFFPGHIFYIRRHPMLKINIPDSISNIKEDGIKDSSVSLMSSELLISSASSMCFEALCLGVKTLVLRITGSMSFNCIPDNILQNWVKESNSDVDKVRAAMMSLIQQEAPEFEKYNRLAIELIGRASHQTASEMFRS
ncbi:MAG: hypothetical protein ACKOX6_07100 [Bdellovibrio sp.]